MHCRCRPSIVPCDEPSEIAGPILNAGQNGERLSAIASPTELPYICDNAIGRSLEAIQCRGFVSDIFRCIISR